MIVWGIFQDREGSWNVDVRSVNDCLGHIPRQGGQLGC